MVHCGNCKSNNVSRSWFDALAHSLVKAPPLFDGPLIGEEVRKEWIAAFIKVAT